MNRIKRAAAITVTLLLIATPCLAENTFETVFKDAFYGGLTGALVGGAAMVFTKQPGKHWDYVEYAGAGGVLVGAAYGAVVATKSLAEYDNGHIKFSMPTIKPEFREAKGQTNFVAMAEIFRGKF
ncbi:hypothetical protein [Geomesophilobacter sediminis]|uniref:Glycine zipper 2TM domain-containing protein n=1 Tax=Geomesophilobacter sediminis TaxID=2798584 RepID=A0A8J7M2N7_9BACT|nr:hypothetical protein [Geomesophilobacter sediminis]MBJ6727532.1 hypothetical protein [Geomesophilobacter sediminis]